MSQNKLSAWEIVKLARHQDRPTAKTLINYLFDDFIELHGDRLFRDDRAIIGGIAKLGKRPVTIIAQEKGVTTQERITHNFGMPHPEGYRKSLRLMKQAEKFNRPIITIIDTPGAYPGIGAEERGQANAIAVNIQEMYQLTVPVVAIILSEGGSGGALAIGIADEIAMFENAIYSILSPEGFATILFKDSSLANQVAELMKLTSYDLKKLNIIDHIINEGEGLHINNKKGFSTLKKWLTKTLDDLVKIDKDKLIDRRYMKYRNHGFTNEKVGELND